MFDLWWPKDSGCMAGVGFRREEAAWIPKYGVDWSRLNPRADGFQLKNELH